MSEKQTAKRRTKKEKQQAVVLPAAGEPNGKAKEQPRTPDFYPPHNPQNAR